MTIYISKPPIIDSIPQNGHCVIEASAGTGKTFTIQHLFLDLLLKGAKPQDFLIVTFTRKATEELKKRLKEILTNALQACQSNQTSEISGPHWTLEEQEIANLKNAIREFYKAQVSTIDSLTQRILRENLDIAHVQSDAKVQNSVPMIRAFEHFTRNIVPNDPWLIAMMAAYDQYIYEGLDNIDPAEKEYFSPPETLYADLTDFTTQRADQTTTMKLPPQANTTRDLLESYHKWFNAARDALQTQDIHAFLTLAKSELESLDSQDFFKTFESVTLTLKRSKPYAWVRLASTCAKLNLDDKLFHIHENTTYTHTTTQNIVSMMLYGFSKKHFVAEYALEKYRQCMQNLHIEQATYQFDTYTEMLCQTLNSPESDILASRLRKHWKFAIIDEFQDTSPAQWQIVEKCFLNHPEETRLFLIGDPKQAIYAFRSGDVYTYKMAVKRIRDMFGDNHILALTHNYRSTPAILDIINQFYYRESETSDNCLFAQVPQDHEHYDYRNVYNHIIQTGYPNWKCLFPDHTPCPALSLIPIDDSQNKDSNTLADAIVSELQYYLSASAPGIQKKDKLERFKKIYILARSNRDFTYLKKRLVLAGIPYASSSTSNNENLYQTPEILELTRIMMAIQSPLKPGYLAAALHTSFFALNTYEVAEQIESEKSTLKEQFRRWSEMSHNPTNFTQIFEEILQITQFEHRLALFSYTMEPYENVKEVIDELCTRALLHNLDWDGLLDWMHQMRTEGINSETTTASNAPIQLMTIHKCKGLEADVVFLIYPKEYSSSSNAVADKKARYYHVFENNHWKRILRPPKTSQQTLQQAYFETAQEDERLLYVALTRASVRLYLPRYLSVGNEDTKASSSKTRKTTKSTKTPTFPDIHLRLQNILLHHYGTTVPTEMMPLYTRPHAVSPHPETTLQDATQAFLNACQATKSTNTIPSRRPLHTTPLRAQQIASYSSLTHRAKTHDAYSHATELVPDVWHSAPKAPPQNYWPELPKGRITGLFLHAILERIPYHTVYNLRHHTADTWLDAHTHEVDEIRQLFARCAREYQFPNEAVKAAQKLVFLTLTTPQPEFAPQGICAADKHRAELEFLIRYQDIIDDNDTPQEDIELCNFFQQMLKTSEQNILQTGDMLTGSIDCCYQLGNTWYILDWKSDNLDDYSPTYLQNYVNEHYAYQVAIYQHAFKRMLRTMLPEDTHYHFGGMIYVFIRGIIPGTNNGFVFLPS